MNIFKRLILRIKAKIVKDPTIIIKAEISLKLKAAKKKGYVGPVSKEIDFIKGKNFLILNSVVLDKLGVKYLRDLKKVGKKYLQWDYQFDSIRAFERGGGDCNTINRIIQVHNHVKGTPSFLVTYVTAKLVDNHTTCILKTKDGYVPCDYGYYNPNTAFKTMKEAVYCVAGDSLVLMYAVQDINWNFVKL
jgi:hypothetical protein